MPMDKSRLDEDGKELLDGTPMAPPIGYRKQPSLSDQIRAMVRSEKLRLEVESAGAESFEEADDFDVGDDYDPRSPYEEVFDPTPIEELKRRQAAAKAPPPKPKKGKSADQADTVDEAAQPPSPQSEQQDD